MFTNLLPTTGEIAITYKTGVSVFNGFIHLCANGDIRAQKADGTFDVRYSSGQLIAISSNTYVKLFGDFVFIKVWDFNNQISDVDFYGCGNCVYLDISGIDEMTSIKRFNGFDSLEYAAFKDINVKEIIFNAALSLVAFQAYNCANLDTVKFSIIQTELPYGNPNYLKPQNLRYLDFTNSNKFITDLNAWNSLILHIPALDQFVIGGSVQPEILGLQEFLSIRSFNWFN